MLSLIHSFIQEIFTCTWYILGTGKIENSSIQEIQPSGGDIVTEKYINTIVWDV